MKKEHEEFIIDDRLDLSVFDIFSESEKKELFEIVEQKEKEYGERRKNMTKEERAEASEKHNIEIEQIFEQFKDRAMKRQQNTATA